MNTSNIIEPRRWKDNEPSFSTLFDRRAHGSDDVIDMSRKKLELDAKQMVNTGWDMFFGMMQANASFLRIGHSFLKPSQKTNPDEENGPILYTPRMLDSDTGLPWLSKYLEQRKSGTLFRYPVGPEMMEINLDFDDPYMSFRLGYIQNFSLYFGNAQGDGHRLSFKPDELEGEHGFTLFKVAQVKNHVEEIQVCSDYLDQLKVHQSFFGMFSFAQMQKMMRPQFSLAAERDNPRKPKRKIKPPVLELVVKGESGFEPEDMSAEIEGALAENLPQNPDTKTSIALVWEQHLDTEMLERNAQAEEDHQPDLHLIVDL